MAQHRAATPGGPDIVLDSPAELATALLERLGALPTQPRGRSRRHSSTRSTRSTLFVPQQAVSPESGAALAGTGLAGAVQTGSLPAVLRRPGARPAIAAVSVSAIGAVAAITATGGFAAVAPASLSASLSTGSVPAAADAHPPAPALIAAPAAAPAAAEPPTVQVPAIVGQVTAAAKELAQRAQAAPAHVPKPTPPATSPASVKGSGAAGAALAAAMTAIGRPYRWGATGPTAFDCSGLVQWAFAKAGAKLPRTAAAQSQVGTEVTRAQLQPGDLVFFYSPVSHVGIYVGGGKVVNATQTGEPVQLSNIAHMPVHNMRRISA